jgi:hypothetical protein
MPKCPNGHDYLSGELHCPECFEPVPIVTMASNEPAAGKPQPAKVNQGAENEGDPFAGLFNNPPQADDIRELLNPTGSVNISEPAASPANAPVQLEQVPVVPDPLQSRTASLKVIHGQGAGTEFALTSETNMIGRWDPSIKAFVQVDLTAVDVESKVSRKHAQITFANGVYFIEDLGSANGTYVNRGERLIPGNKEPLNDGDEIIMGKTFLKFILV